MRSGNGLAVVLGRSCFNLLRAAACRTTYNKCTGALKRGEIKRYSTLWRTLAVSVFH